MAAASIKRTSLVWFKNTDLRLHDHLPLINAHKSSDSVIHLMVVDNFWFTNKSRLLHINKCGAFRCKFLMESILDLRRNLNALHSQLIVRFGDSAQIIPAIAQQFNVAAIYHHSEIHSEEQHIVDQVTKQCAKLSNNQIKFVSYWGGNTMYHPDDLPFAHNQNMNNLPDSFTKFRKVMEQKAVIQEPVQPLTQKLCKPHPKFHDIGQISSLKQFGCSVDQIEIDKRSQFPFHGGETAAFQRLTSYIWGDQSSSTRRQKHAHKYGAITTYKQTRNQSIGTEYSTKFSPFLAHGCISPRVIYQHIQDFEQRTGISNESTYWVYFELLWRDFFRFSSVKYGDRIFYLHGPYNNKQLQWNQNKRLFEMWCRGETGYPFIDAAMVELKQTGFMSNRLRQNVASFLVKDLGVDWRFGAEWFESLLVDYDAAQNYCNWNYVAGIGFDPRAATRYFNIQRQADMYDADGEYVRLWIEALKGVNREFVHRPYEMNEYQQRMSGCVVGRDYAAPCKSLSGRKQKIKEKYYKQKNDGNGSEKDYGSGQREQYRGGNVSKYQEKKQWVKRW